MKWEGDSNSHRLQALTKQKLSQGNSQPPPHTPATPTRLTGAGITSRPHTCRHARVLLQSPQQPASQLPSSYETIVKVSLTHVLCQRRLSLQKPPGVCIRHNTFSTTDSGACFPQNNNTLQLQRTIPGRQTEVFLLMSGQHWSQLPDQMLNHFMLFKAAESQLSNSDHLELLL